MFPADFDGIIAGSPGLDWSGRSAQAVRVAQALQKENARLSPAKQQLLHNAVVQACDALDSAHEAAISAMPPEIVAVDIALATEALGSITGAISSEDILDAIFREFCIGK